MLFAVGDFCFLAGSLRLEGIKDHLVPWVQSGWDGPENRKKACAALAECFLLTIAEEWMCTCQDTSRHYKYFGPCDYQNLEHIFLTTKASRSTSCGSYSDLRHA